MVDSYSGPATVVVGNHRWGVTVNLTKTRGSAGDEEGPWVWSGTMEGSQEAAAAVADLDVFTLRIGPSEAHAKVDTAIPDDPRWTVRIEGAGGDPPF